MYYAYQYDYSGNRLNRKANMLKPRSHHAICYLKGYVYVIGGVIDTGQGRDVPA